MLKHWGVVGGLAAALAAGLYVLWGPITKRRKRPRGLVPGLLNGGNTCFLNALLQGLAACPSFIRWLEVFSGSRGVQSLASTLLQLLHALSRERPAEDGVLDAGGLLAVLRLYRWHISSCEEQDAHELFHVLTSSLEEERDRQPRVAHLFDLQSLQSPPAQAEETMICRSRAPLHPIPSPWKSQHPFHGRLTSNMSCRRCQQQSPMRYDSFESLSLPLPPPQWGRRISLDQCLQLFISSEAIKEVECENCTKLQQGNTVTGRGLESQRTTFMKQLQLGKLPQCLCIHLQRLTWSSEGAPLKRQEHVQFAERLSMDRYKQHGAARRGRPIPPAPLPTEGSARGPEAERPLPNGARPPGLLRAPLGLARDLRAPLGLARDLRAPLGLARDVRPAEYLFQLAAVLVHHGDMHSGHFVTYRRSPSSSSPRSPQWLWVSDDSVRKASRHEVLSSSAYMLFYERARSVGPALGPEDRPVPLP